MKGKIMEYTLHTKTIKVELMANAQTPNIGKTELKQLLKDTQYLCGQASNNVVVEYCIWDTKNRSGYQKINQKEVLEKGLHAYIEDMVKDTIPYLQTGNTAALRNRLASNWENFKKDEYFKGSSKRPSYNSTYPIDIKADNLRVIKSASGTYSLAISFFSTKAEDFFIKKVEEYQTIVQKEKKQNKENKSNKSDEKSANERRLESYQKILEHVRQKDNKLTLKIVNPNGNIKATLDDIINYKTLTDDLEKQKLRLKQQRSTMQVQEYKDALANKNMEIKNVLNVPNTAKNGTGQLKLDQKDGKVYCYISFSFMSAKNTSLDANKILGIDLGIKNIATMQIYNCKTKDYERLNWKSYTLNGDELIAYRQKLHGMGMSKEQIADMVLKENMKTDSQMFNNKDTYQLGGDVLNEVRNKLNKRKVNLSIATKWAGDGSSGHGTQTRRQHVEKMELKFGNFKDTYNHKVSRYIVDFAIKNQCGKIVMENLSKFAVHQKESMLKNWAYYDLQNKVKYKAMAAGIAKDNIEFINPAYTSQRCSVCGCIDATNRDIKVDQKKFECVKCGHKDNADVNAAKNIALPGIVDKIKTTLNKNKNEGRILDESELENYIESLDE